MKTSAAEYVPSRITLPVLREAVQHCRGCEAEITILRPEIIVCMGATAALSVFGRDYRLTKERGKFVEHVWAPHATSTVHPSAILRAPDDQRHLEYERFVADLVLIRQLSASLVSG